jgi:beta-lactam-binding protein with PASTA domain
LEKQYEEHAYLSGMVIRVLHKGKALNKESTVKRGDKVTLVVGMLSNEKVQVPSLIGLSLDSAVYLLSDRRLAVGATLYEGEIATAADSAAARVYRQNPAHEANRTITVGTPVDLFLRVGPAPDSDGTDGDGLFD